jgi:outer membrane lipoprotein LolB
LSTSDGRTESDADPDALTEKLLGWRLPIAGLPYWVRGRALPSLPAQQTTGAGGRLATLNQAGWNIEYQAYHETLAVPARLSLRRDTIDLRLVLDQWQPVAERTP